MVLAEIGRQHERGDHGAAAERILVLGERPADRTSQPPGRGKHSGDACGEQRDDDRLLFSGQQRDQISRAGRQREQPGHKPWPLPVRAHTRSLIFSRISPVGRQAMMAITTAKANTSL